MSQGFKVYRLTYASKIRQKLRSRDTHNAGAI
ncbi:hypothetical protein NOVOSPHI9U_630007 [Novosphingobium sp. 9U]|nr:hypothetical protein NOVOSPHI9U_630007 [Novosphingobium sp. 9U]